MTEDTVMSKPDANPDEPPSGQNEPSSLDASDLMDNDAVMRPTIFSHPPKPRLPPIERYYGASPSALGRFDVLEEVKSNRFEGIYNLSFIFLVFSLAYLAVRNVMEIGFQFTGTSHCLDKLRDDSIASARFLVSLPPWLAYSFILVKMHVSFNLPQSTVMFFHFFGMGAYYVLVSSMMLQSSINPLFALILSGVIVVVSLKQHSWVTTNLILSEETEQLHKARREREPNTPEKSNPSDSDDSHATHASGRSVGNTNPSTRKRDGRSLIDVRREHSIEWTRENASEDTGAAILIVQQEKVPFPKNVTITNFARFVVYPTLVYETSYPQTVAMRPRLLAWYLFQSALCGCADYLLLAQFCVPVWRSARDLDRLWFFCMKLALPSFLCWLLMFWGFFHCVLSAIAEVTQFADREFYQDWWNSTTIEGFWRKWNRPVHEWCLRHIYVDSMSRHKIEKSTAALGTFLFSAIMHEYICLIGFRLLRPYMFLGMMIQVPLVALSRGMAHTRIGNMLMWIMLFLGQPIILLLYVRDYLTQNGTIMC